MALGDLEKAKMALVQLTFEKKKKSRILSLLRAVSEKSPRWTLIGGTTNSAADWSKFVSVSSSFCISNFTSRVSNLHVTYTARNKGLLIFSSLTFRSLFLDYEKFCCTRIYEINVYQFELEAH